MILVTGTSGFIGKHLLQKLVSNFGKNNILALTSKPTTECNYILHNNYDFEPDYLLKNKYHKITSIIHAGAFIPKKSGDSNNISQCNSNIYNTEKLLNLELPQLKEIVFLSTVDVYKNSNDRINENSTIKPETLYGLSKYYCEKMIEKYCHKINIPYSILRVGHVYGPGEEQYQKLIPIVIKNVLKEKPVTLFGKGNDIRTFIYISDVVDSIIKSIENSANNVINVVGNNEISIGYLINKIYLLSNKKVVLNKVSSNNKPRNLVFDNKRLKNELHQPKVGLDEGLKNEIDYFKKL